MGTEISDSQVSDLYDDIVLNEIKNHVDLDNLPVFEDEIFPDQKFSIEQNASLQINKTENDSENYVPPPVNIPIIEEYSGHYNFEIAYGQKSGKHCVYSQNLGKIYIDMEHHLTLRFKWDPPISNLWLRTSLVYSEDQDRGTPVRRCLNHAAMASSCNQNVSTEILKQVIRCTHPDSVYEEVNGHMTVAVPLRAQLPESSYILLDFTFHCKNSCSSGMNRRATKLVFTLETENRQVIGRRNLNVRICSCPKRDKEKEEEVRILARAEKKRKSIPQQINFYKGRRSKPMSNNATDLHMSLKLPNKEIANEVLWSTYQILAAKTLSGSDNYTQYMDKIKQKIETIIKP